MLELFSFSLVSVVVLNSLVMVFEFSVFVWFVGSVVFWLCVNVVLMVLVCWLMYLMMLFDRFVVFRILRFSLLFVGELFEVISSDGMLVFVMVSSLLRFLLVWWLLIGLVVSFCSVLVFVIVWVVMVSFGVLIFLIEFCVFIRFVSVE